MLDIKIWISSCFSNILQKLRIQNMQRNLGSKAQFHVRNSKFKCFPCFLYVSFFIKIFKPTEPGQAIWLARISSKVSCEICKNLKITTNLTINFRTQKIFFVIVINKEDKNWFRRVMGLIRKLISKWLTRNLKTLLIFWLLC